MFTICSHILNPLLIVLVILIIYKYCNNSEFFVNKEDRAYDITRWFNNKQKNEISYSDYKNDVEHSDIIEYTTAKKLHKNNSLNAESMIQHM